MARETIILTRQEIGAQVGIVDGIDAIEQAMGAFEKGNDYLPPKAIFEIPVGPSGTTYAACITGYTKAAGLLSMKVGQERTDNPSRGLPTTNSWIHAFDPVTGELLMVCDGTLPTMYRTAAAAGGGDPTSGPGRREGTDSDRGGSIGAPMPEGREHDSSLREGSSL